MKTGDIKSKFVGIMENGASVTKACKLLNINRSTFYDWLEKDAKFAEAYIKAKTICMDETNDAAAFHYHKKVREGDPKFVRKWLDQQHPDFVRKTLNVLFRKEDGDAGLLSLEPEQLFLLMKAYKHAGFTVDGLSEKLKKQYDEWVMKNSILANETNSNKISTKGIKVNLNSQGSADDED